MTDQTKNSGTKLLKKIINSFLEHKSLITVASTLIAVGSFCFFAGFGTQAFFGLTSELQKENTQLTKENTIFRERLAPCENCSDRKQLETELGYFDKFSLNSPDFIKIADHVLEDLQFETLGRTGSGVHPYVYGKSGDYILIIQLAVKTQTVFFSATGYDKHKLRNLVQEASQQFEQRAIQKLLNSSN